MRLVTRATRAGKRHGGDHLFSRNPVSFHQSSLRPGGRDLCGPDRRPQTKRNFSRSCRLDSLSLSSSCARSGVCEARVSMRRAVHPPRHKKVCVPCCAKILLKKLEPRCCLTRKLSEGFHKVLKTNRMLSEKPENLRRNRDRPSLERSR